MAEAGRESNERIGQQQLSLIDHRESDYINALETALLRDAAHAASTSHKRIPESIITSGSNEISVARKHRGHARFATNQVERHESLGIGRRLARRAAIPAPAALSCAVCCHCNER